ncbi:uncharacterized protein K489DRAFT_380948 [Dissoconium aciculare CBS 342.82]|uniref:Uncharacterized protein n=1 Tax=Dissoconium aciculare CBS 342.82 TaxID=1314786 RepID=A0A6J3M2G2_9PEZI|nr:uncharacterized protein K489DRAFT_380948 [Dissoconium aciculare CBS 342.82]KAF1822205.1 hypothetical protein K489DRAFT_380948 [Dissoconium aciculare CBS 342.82]
MHPRIRSQAVCLCPLYLSASPVPVIGPLPPAVLPSLQVDHRKSPLCSALAPTGVGHADNIPYETCDDSMASSVTPSSECLSRSIAQVLMSHDEDRVASGLADVSQSSSA